MEKLVIIGANDFQNQLILKAKSMGFETHVFAWAEGAVGEKTADHFYPVSIVEKEKILEVCKEIKPSGVVSIASDLASITVNYLMENLGLVAFNTQECVKCSTNKYEMRKAFKKAGIPIPKFQSVSSIDEVDLEGYTFPVIVKPTDRSGSRAITKILKKEELLAAVNSAIENSFEKRAIIEEFIKGIEYSCECISFNGKHQFLALTRKFTTEAPHFIETGHRQPSGVSDKMLKKVIETVYSALTALGVKYGASHSELRIDSNGNIRLIEIGARMGGDCIGSDLVHLSTGYDFVKMVIDVAVGNQPDMTKDECLGNSAILFIFTKADLEKLERVKKEYGDCIYRISEIEPIESHDVVDSSSRHGYYILTSDSKEKIDRILEL